MQLLERGTVLTLATEVSCKVEGYLTRSSPLQRYRPRIVTGTEAGAITMLTLKTSKPGKEVSELEGWRYSVVTDLENCSGELLPCNQS